MYNMQMHNTGREAWVRTGCLPQLNRQACSCAIELFSRDVVRFHACFPHLNHEAGACDVEVVTGEEATGVA